MHTFHYNRYPVLGAESEECHRGVPVRWSKREFEVFEEDGHRHLGFQDCKILAKTNSWPTRKGNEGGRMIACGRCYSISETLRPELICIASPILWIFVD
uniref:Uncharacterized protein n=1 Tax=Picea sitchensis TaxID=3332 RepID=A9NRL0_PICSI|nr:unknown [Picea sitchensis]